MLNSLQVWIVNERIFENITGINIKTIKHGRLEADDCIAILTKKIVETQPDSKIIIITSDTDYLQILQENVTLLNLKFKPVNTPKNSFDCSKKNLLYKIIIGDKSDNIPSVFKKCGPKKTLNYINDIELFEKHLYSFKSSQCYPF